MMDKLREMSKWSRDQLVERMEYLQQMSGIALERAVAASSDAARTLVTEIETRLAQVRSTYLGIDATSFPNVVVASLASLQGQEREILTQMRMWKNAKDVKKELDEELRICENLINDKDSRSL